MSERNAKLLRKYEKFVSVVPRATTRKAMVRQLIETGHLGKIKNRMEARKNGRV